MRKLLFTAGLLTAISMMVPSDAVSQDKGKGKDKVKQEATTDEDYTKLAKAKELTGKLTTLDPTAKALTIKAEYQTKEPIPPKNANAAQQLQNLQLEQQRLTTEYQQILNIKNPTTRAQRLQSWQLRYSQWQNRYQTFLSKNQTQYKTVTHAKDYELDIDVDVKVARQNLPVEYDDKGNIKEYTKEELKKMRDKDLPGYTAKFEDVQPGQTVKLYVAAPKPAKKDKENGKKEKTEGETGAKEPGTKVG